MTSTLSSPSSSSPSSYPNSDSTPNSKSNSFVSAAFYTYQTSSSMPNDNPAFLPTEAELRELFPMDQLPITFLKENNIPFDDHFLDKPSSVMGTATTTNHWTYHHILTSSSLALPCFLATLTSVYSNSSTPAHWSQLYQERFLQFYLYMPNYQKYNAYFDPSTPIHQAILDQCSKVSLAPYLYPFPSWYTRTLRLFSRNEAASLFLGQHPHVIPYLCEWLSSSITNASLNTIHHTQGQSKQQQQQQQNAISTAILTSFPSHVDANRDRALDTLHVFATLANLALVDANQPPLLHHHVVTLLVQSLHEYQTNAEMVPELLAAFSNLVFYPDALQEVSVDTPKYLLALLEQHSLKRAWMLHGLHVLSVMHKSFLDTSIRPLFLRLLKKTLVLYPYDEPMMYACLSTLGNFFANDGTIPDPSFFKALDLVIHRFPHQVNVLIGAFFAMAQMLNCLAASEMANYVSCMDLGWIVQVASHFEYNESFQTTICFLWSVMARSPSIRASFYHYPILQQIQRAMITRFPSGLDQHHHVFLGSSLLQFTKNEMLKLFASVTIMHLAEVVPDQGKLLEARTLDTLIECMYQVEHKKQLSFLMQFILQRLVKDLDTPVVYFVPTFPPRLTELVSFHLNNYPSCARCFQKYPDIQCYAVCKETGQWIGGLPQQYLLCRSCLSLDRQHYGFARHKGHGQVFVNTIKEKTTRSPTKK